MSGLADLARKNRAQNDAYEKMQQQQQHIQQIPEGSVRQGLAGALEERSRWDPKKMTEADFQKKFEEIQRSSLLPRQKQQEQQKWRKIFSQKFPPQNEAKHGQAEGKAPESGMDGPANAAMTRAMREAGVIGPDEEWKW